MKKSEKEGDHLKVQTTKSLFSLLLVFFVLFVSLLFCHRSIANATASDILAVAVAAVAVFSIDLHTCVHGYMHAGYCLRIISTANSSCAVIFPRTFALLAPPLLSISMCVFLSFDLNAHFFLFFNFVAQYKNT